MLPLSQRGGVRPCIITFDFFRAELPQLECDNAWSDPSGDRAIAVVKKQVYLNRLRKLIKTFPEATERLTWDHPTFRVRDKIFATFGEHEGKASITVKQIKAKQEALCGDARFFVPAYVGRHGWVGIFVEEVEWGFVADLVDQAYRLTAPKALVRLLDEE